MDDEDAETGRERELELLCSRNASLTCSIMKLGKIRHGTNTLPALAYSIHLGTYVCPWYIIIDMNPWTYTGPRIGWRRMVVLWE